MKLFYAPGSSSLSPHIVLYEAGLSFVAVKVNEHTKVIEGGGDYREVNPLGYVPALLLDNGTVLTEGAAIVQYIADQVPFKNLAPPNGTIERTKLQSYRKKGKTSFARGSRHDLPISMSISEATSILWGAITRLLMHISSSCRIGRVG
jgi:glutathione S-transferase